MWDRFLQLVRVCTLVGILGLTLPVSSQAQCAVCKAQVESATGEESEMAGGINTGILYLFILPYMTFMVIGFFWYRGYKRKKRQELAADLAEAQSQDLPDALNPNLSDSNG